MWSQPIDWLALAAQRPGSMRKGDRHTPATIAKIKAAQKAWRKRRQREALARREAMKPQTVVRAHRVVEGVFTCRRRIALGMEPGRWYGRPDIYAASGIRDGSVRVTVARMLRTGYLERTRNPDYRPHVYVRGVPVHLQAAREPMWLYRLTALGEAVRREASFLE